MSVSGVTSFLSKRLPRREAVALLLLPILTLSLMPGVMTRASAAGPSIGSGITSFDVTANSINILNTNKLSSGPLQVSGYDAGTLVKVVLTSNNGILGITSSSGLTLVPGYQANLTDTATSIAFSGTVANLNTALNTLKYLAPGASGTATISATVTAIGKDGVVYNSANGHYYQYVSTAVTWLDAFQQITGTDYRALNGGTAVQSGTAGYTFNGRRGYFATIMNSSEQTFVKNLLGGAEAWIGASNLAWPNDRCASGRHPLGQKGYFKWTDPASPDYAGGDNRIVVNGFGITPTYSNWDAGEPNMASSPGDEIRCDQAAGAYMYANGLWDDTYAYYFQNASQYYSPTHRGFVVEYGDSPSDVPSEVSPITRTLNVNILASQNPIRITNTNLSPTIGDTVTVTAEGGESTGAGITFNATGSGCSIDPSGTNLTAGIDTTCSVTATKAGDGAWLPATSAPVLFDFNPITQTADLRITNTNLVINSSSETITLTAAGGSGTGAYTFASQSENCTINGNTLSPLLTGNCLVIVTRAPSGKYAVATSQYPAYFYINLSSSKVDTGTIVINSYDELTIGNTITLRTNLVPAGSLLEPAMSYSVSGSGCLYNSTNKTLTTYDTVTAPTTCSVFAYWNNVAPYSYSRSDVKTFYFGAKNAAPLVLPNSFNPSPRIGETLTVTATGGDETATASFPFVYSVTGTNCPAGVSSNNGKSVDIRVTATAYCSVIVSQAAHGVYKFNSSSSVTIAFGKITSNKVLVVQTPSPTPYAGDSITVTATTTDSDVLNQSDVSFSVTGTNCSYNNTTKRLTTSGVAYCTIIASWSPSSIYNYAQSAAKTIVFDKVTPTGVLTVKDPFSAPTANGNTSLQATYTVGGVTTDVAGSDVTFILSPSTGCYLSGNTLSSIGVANCTVFARWSNSSSYTYAQSAAKTITFGKYASSTTLVVRTPIQTPKAGDKIDLAAQDSNGADVNLVDVDFIVSGDNCTYDPEDKTLKATGIAYCNVIAYWSNSSIYTYAQSPSNLISFGARAPENLLVISTSADSYNAMTTVTLTPQNGTGNGNPVITYSVFGAPGACWQPTPTTLRSDIATTCTVIAKQAAFGNYLATQSVSKTITFNRITSPALNLPTLSGSAFTSLSLSATGGNGGQITYSVTPAGCTTGLSGTNSETLTITTSAAITCTVTASQNQTATYKFVNATKSYSFVAINPTPLTFAANLSGNALETLTVTASGGDETATATTPIVYRVSGTNCPAGVSSNNGRSVDIRTSTVAYCTVLASQAAHGAYKYVISSSVTIPFNAIASPDLVVPTLSGTAGTPLPVLATGGNGGPITYLVSGSGCSPLGTVNSSLSISTTGPAYCTVQAKQNAFGVYRSVISAAKTITFSQSTAPDGLVVTSNDIDADKTLTLTSNALSISPAAASQVRFKVTGTGCGAGDNKTAITTTGEAFCTVVAYWPSTSMYFYKESVPKTIHFLTYEQGTFTINNSGASTSVVRGTSITITTKGGAGNGAVTFAKKAGDGCTLTQPTGSGTSATLTSGDARICTITATKAAAGKYKSATSQSVVFTFKVG